MAKEVFVRDKPHVNIGTLGDVDYGMMLTAGLGQLDYDTFKLGSRHFPELTLSVDDDARSLQAELHRPETVLLDHGPEIIGDQIPSKVDYSYY